MARRALGRRARRGARGRACAGGERVVVGADRALDALAGVTRVDALERLEIGGVLQREARLQDVPFDRVSGEVILIPSAAALRKLPANVQRLRLVAVGEQGETLLGDYTFAHTPS